MKKTSYTYGITLVLVFAYLFGFNYQISKAQSYVCADIKANLKQGARGLDVPVLQKFLIHAGYLSGKPNGIFNVKTKNALISYQRNNDIVPASGILGSITRSKIKAQSCGNLNVSNHTGENSSVSNNGNMVYFSTSFFNFNYIFGDSLSASLNNNQIIVTNGSNSNVNVKISLDNQPKWLNTLYSKDVFTIQPGQPAGIGVSVDPTGLSAGSYQTNIKISGNFSGSPKIIPITLEVSSTVGVDAAGQYNSKVLKSVKNDFNRITFNNIPSDWVVLANDFSGTVVSTDVSSSHSAGLVFLPSVILKDEYVNKFTSIKDALSGVSPNLSLDDIQRNMMEKYNQSTTTKDWTVIEKLSDGNIGNKPALVSTISATNIKSGKKNILKQVVFLNNNIIYTILFTYNDSDHNLYLPIFDNIKNFVTFY